MGIFLSHRQRHTTAMIVGVVLTVIAPSINAASAQNGGAQPVTLGATLNDNATNQSANNSPKPPDNSAQNTNQNAATPNNSSNSNNTANIADNPDSDSIRAPGVPNATDPNAPTLLETLVPNDSELSLANTTLLAENAKLTREIDDLTTQVNVLIAERSGQLFVYGASTALFSVILGFFLAKLTGRKRW